MSKIYIITETQEFDGGYYSADSPLTQAGWFTSEEDAQDCINKMCAAISGEYWRRQYKNDLSVVALASDQAIPFLDNFIKEQKVADAEEAESERTCHPASDLMSATAQAFYGKIKDKASEGYAKGDLVHINIPGLHE